MRAKIFAAAVVLAPLPLAGCFHIEGVHLINTYGSSDEGSYVIAVRTDVQAQLRRDGEWAAMVDFARANSVPKVTEAGGYVTLADRSGGAVMETAYDEFGCTPSAGSTAFYDCHFAMAAELDDSDWTFAWTVLVRPGFEVLDSNAQKQGSEDGMIVLSWAFAGGVDAGIDVDFTVRAPVDPAALP